jgi:hypothetical protein
MDRHLVRFVYLIFFISIYSQEDIKCIFHQFAYHFLKIEFEFNSIES